MAHRAEMILYIAVEVILCVEHDIFRRTKSIAWTGRRCKEVSQAIIQMRGNETNKNSKNGGIFGGIFELTYGSQAHLGACAVRKSSS
jgi:hypothetical protein